MPSHGNYYLSLLSVSQLSTPTLSLTVSEMLIHVVILGKKQGIVVSQQVWGGLMILWADAAIK